jgi:hypothetical protein
MKLSPSSHSDNYGRCDVSLRLALLLMVFGPVAWVSWGSETTLRRDICRGFPLPDYANSNRRCFLCHWPVRYLEQCHVLEKALMEGNSITVPRVRKQTNKEKPIQPRNCPHFVPRKNGGPLRCDRNVLRIMHHFIVLSVPYACNQDLALELFEDKDTSPMR